jgi:hypothetical protein
VVRELKILVLAGLAATWVAGCSLNLDESLIAQDVPTLDGGGDAPLADGDASLESQTDATSDPSKDPAQEPGKDQSNDPLGDPVPDSTGDAAKDSDTGISDAKSDAIDTGIDGDAGCSAPTGSSACVVCGMQQCCTEINDCAVSPACGGALNAYVACLNGDAGPGNTCSSAFAQQAGQSGNVLANCVATGCPICP